MDRSRELFDTLQGFRAKMEWTMSRIPDGRLFEGDYVGMCTELGRSGDTIARGTSTSNVYYEAGTQTEGA